MVCNVIPFSTTSFPYGSEYCQLFSCRTEIAIAYATEQRSEFSAAYLVFVSFATLTWLINIPIASPDFVRDTINDTLGKRFYIGFIHYSKYIDTVFLGRPYDEFLSSEALMFFTFRSPSGSFRIQSTMTAVLCQS